MKYVKMFGLPAIAVAALMAFAGTAIASSVTSPPGTVYTGAIKAQAEGYATLHNAVGTISCVSTLEGSILKHGASVTAGGSSKLTFTGCTNGTVHESILEGPTEIHPLPNGNGTVTMDIKVTITMFGFECGLSEKGTHIGEYTAGTNGIVHLNAEISRTHGSFFCGSTANWTGTYKFTTPKNLAIS